MRVQIGMLFCLAFLNFLLATTAMSESSQGAAGNLRPRHDFFLQAGTFLPYGVYGVRDQYPFAGAKFSHPFMIWRLEWGAQFINAKAVSYANVSASLLFELDFSDLQLNAYLGPDAHYYRGYVVNATREFPATFVAGWHMGFGPVFKINSEWKLRADFKINYNPGNTLFAGVGIVWSPTPSEVEKDPPQ